MSRLACRRPWITSLGQTKLNNSMNVSPCWPLGISKTRPVALEDRLCVLGLGP
jgi:hypothetical protein